MPKILEAKLKREYPNNPHAVYGTLNKIEKAKEAHKAGAPYKTAYDAINSPTYSAMHKAIREHRKGRKMEKALENKKK